MAAKAPALTSPKSLIRPTRVEPASTPTERPAPAEPPAPARVPWSPLGLALALAFIGTLLVVVLPVLLHSGDVGAIVHGLAFLLTGGLVAGGILYQSTLSA